MLASSQCSFFRMAVSSGSCKDKVFQKENPSHWTLPYCM